MSREQKIAFISHSTSWGGLEMNLVRYAAWMKERGWDVVLIGVKDSSLLRRAKELGLSVRETSSDKKKIWKKEVLEHLRQEGVDLIWFRQKDLQKLIPYFKRKLPKLKALYQQGMQLGKPKRDLYHSWIYRFIDHWITPNEFMHQQVKEWTRISNERVHCIPLGIDLEELRSKRLEKSIARKELQIEEEAQLIGVIGRIDPQKNQHTVLDAFIQLSSKHPSAELLFMGDLTHGEGNEYLQSLEQKVKESQLKERVHFRPYTPRVELFYSSVDLMIVPSLFESFGRVTLEGMSFGLPVIGANTGGTAELIGKGNTHLLFPPEDSKACAKCIDSLIGSASSLSAVATELSKRIDQEFSHETVLQKLEEVISEA